MWSTVYDLSISAVRSDALFVSALQRSDNPGVWQVRQAVAQAVREFGSRGCVERVAQEFGDHPESAVLRMRWARDLVQEIFEAPRRQATQMRLMTRPAALAARAA
jgi:hypothetical protein